MRFLTRFILRYSLAIVILGAIFTIPCLYWTKQLYGNLRPDVEELLPRQSRSIQDLGEIRQRLQSVANLAVLITSDGSAGAKRYQIELAQRLEKLPSTVAAGVEYRIDKELQFFNRRKALFVDSADLTRVRNFVRDRIDFETQLYNPINIFSEAEIPEPKLDFPALMNKYSAKSASFSRFPDGLYSTPDGKKRVVLIYLPADGSGITGVFNLKKTVAAIVDGLDAKSYSPSIQVLYTGDVQNTIEEYSALVEDIERSAEIVFALVTAFLWIYFGSWLAVACLFFSLFMARFWTFAAAWFTVGYLNANSAFMGSLLLGTGITFGVMLLSRYLEERRNHREPARAAWIAMNRTARATWTGALAAAMAYGSLMLTRFEGFKQYGTIGFMGMILCWISSIVIFPAVLVQIERIKPIVTSKTRVRKPWVFGPLSSLIGRFPKTIVAGFLALSVLSVASFSRFDSSHIIETNLGNLRNKESMTKGSGFLCTYLDEIFQRFLTPIVLLAHSQDEARDIASALRTKQKDPAYSRLVTSVNTIDQFVPDHQARKIATLHEIQKLLPPRMLRRLAGSDQDRVYSFLTPEALKELKQKDLPKMILDKFTEKDGSVGKLVLVEPPVDSSTTWSGKDLNDFVRVVRETGDQVAHRNVPVAGGIPVISDMIEAITQDGPRATLFAFLAVVGLIVVLFRKPRIIALILFALVLGNLWLFGYILATGFKINFLNFIAFPITFGIGIDYGVNVFHRYLHEPRRDIIKVIRETGGAVGLCSLTTITGYSSLIIARNQAFVSFGTLAVIGEITSLIAAVVALPALLILLDRNTGLRKGTPDRRIQPGRTARSRRPVSPEAQL